MPLFSHKNMLSTLRNNYPIRKEFQDGYNKITRHTNLKKLSIQSISFTPFAVQVSRG